MGELKLSENAKEVLNARYLRRNDKQEIMESPEELFAAVARAVAHAELLLGNARQAAFWEERYLQLLTSFEFLPNSPTLMNAGKPLGQLSGCFVLPVEDSIEAIFQAIGDMALVQRSGGGTGMSFSRLRPKDDFIATTSGMASGPVSFMEIFDCATEHVKQGGRRRGANMGVLRVDHPDVMEFIEAKKGDHRLRNFNLSVGVTDRFMKAVQRSRSYELIHPRTGQVTARVDAAKVFGRIAAAAWETGDPGLLFLDAINRTNPTPNMGRIEATNPCGEIPLLPFESCNLGSINLARMVTRGREEGRIDWEKLRSTTRDAMRFLDDVIEVGKYPVPAIEKATRATRKTGLGVMGFAETLVRLGIAYDSKEAVETADEIMRAVSEEALSVSRELARERGVFPSWRGSVCEKSQQPVRNATRTAVAPTGTISIIADTSAAIEPFFALAYRRSHVLEDKTMTETNPLLLEFLERYDLQAERIMAEVTEKGRLSEVKDIPEALKRLFPTALEISPEHHLQIQTAFQKHVDNSVSKTVNLPQNADVEEVKQVYWRAWELGLKGVTVFRYGSKSRQVLSLGAGEKPYEYDHASKCDQGECEV